MPFVAPFDFPFAAAVRRLAQYAFIRWLTARRAAALMRRRLGLRVGTRRATGTPLPLALSRLPSRPRRAVSWRSIRALSASSSRKAFRSVAVTSTSMCGSPQGWIRQRASVTDRCPSPKRWPTRLARMLPFWQAQHVWRQVGVGPQQAGASSRDRAPARKDVVLRVGRMTAGTTDSSGRSP